MFVWEGLRNCAAGNCMAPRTPRDFCHNPHNVRKGAICRRAADTSLESLLLRLEFILGRALRVARRAMGLGRR